MEELSVTESEVIDRDVRNFIEEPALSHALEKCAEASSHIKTVWWEIGGSGESGEKRTLATLIPLCGSDGLCTHLAGMLNDLPTEKRAGELLIQNEKYLENILNHIGDPIFVKDENSRLLLVNDAFCSLFGLARSRVLGKTLAEDVSPEERESFLKIDRAVISSGVENVNEETLTVRGSETKIISTKKTRFVDDRGNKFLIGIIRDITQRKKAELDLKLAKEFTDKLVMSMQEGLIILNLEGRITMVNQSACEMLGYTREEILEMDMPYPMAKPEDFEKILTTKEDVAGGKAQPHTMEFTRKNGNKFQATFLAGNIKDNNGAVIAVFGTLKDISEEVRTQEMLEEIAVRSTKKKDVILKLASLVGNELKASLKQITQLAAETLDVGRVGVWRLNMDKTEIHCEDLYILESGTHQEGASLSRSEYPNYFDALEKSQTVLVEDARNNPVTEQFAEAYLIPHNIRSLMDVFVHSTTGYYGIICFEHVGSQTRRWSADDLEFATSIANVVSLIIESQERQKAEQLIIESNRELSLANAELITLRNKLEQENIYLRNELDLVFNFEEMVYGSAAFSNVLSEVEKVAATHATVLLQGETGTGKELLARAIHNLSIRNNKPLIKVNCSAIPRELLESELFGHRKGSFTGAISNKVGKFELADGGTLFLDEIGELPVEMQPKILRFLQEGEIEMVGAGQPKKLDVRVIAATNRNLKAEIERKNFREDLYFRLNVFPIEVPPLRERREDIPILVEHFVDKFNKEYNKNIQFVSDHAMEKLKGYSWPGNIRELENLIERASILSNGETLTIPGFESEGPNSRVSIRSNNLSLESIQRNHIIQVLEKCDWKISGHNSASELLDLKPSTLRDKMKKLGIRK
nr:sigma 54-interacting transcriptional regulator [Robiginitalea sp. SC105]